MPDAAASITPDSKLGDLLQRWPELERVLVELSPHFRALANPVLRRTVAKVATLRQVSHASGVPLARIVEHLRRAVGPGADALGAADDGAGPAAPRPAWAEPAHVMRRRDARAAIERGEHPLQEVMRDLSELGSGDVYELVTPFLPAPLVDTARAKGFLAHSVADGGDVVRTYFTLAGS